MKVLPRDDFQIQKVWNSCQKSLRFYLTVSKCDVEPCVVNMYNAFRLYFNTPLRGPGIEQYMEKLSLVAKNVINL